MQPKIHKEDNPGRPVISSVNCHTAKISQYVDHHLQSHVQELDSYVEDSTNLIKKVSTIDKVPQGNFFVTVDVRSLANIPPRWNWPCRGEEAYPIRRFTRVHQRGELNWMSQLQPSGHQIFSIVMSRTESILIRQN